MEDKKPIGYLEDKVLEAKKAEHKVKYLHEVMTVDEDENEHVTYFKKPTMDNLQMLADYAKKNEEMKGLQVLFNTCRVDGSAEVLEDDEMRVSAYKALAQIFKRREAVVKKR
jgi:hypothetical protein